MLGEPGEGLLGVRCGFLFLFGDFVWRFCLAFEFDQGYFEGDATDLSRAYWAFPNCLNTEVTAVSE